MAPNHIAVSKHQQCCQLANDLLFSIALRERLFRNFHPRIPFLIFTLFQTLFQLTEARCPEDCDCVAQTSCLIAIRRAAFWSMSTSSLLSRCTQQFASCVTFAGDRAPVIPRCSRAAKVSESVYRKISFESVRNF